jgi:phosphomannomutase
MREVERTRIEEYARTATTSAFTPSGMLKTARDLPPIEGAAEERYVRRYLASFGAGGLSGLRVLVYEHSAVGRDILGRILGELGAEVAAAGRTETFVPIDTENVTDELVERLEGLVAAEASGRPLDRRIHRRGFRSAARGGGPTCTGGRPRPSACALPPRRPPRHRGRRVPAC